MIEKHVTNAFAYSFTGLFLQFSGYFVQKSFIHTTGLMVGALLYLLGTGLLFVGLISAARAKGRDPGWGALAFFSLFGLIVLLLLKDLAVASESTSEDRSEDAGTALVEKAAALDFTGNWEEAVQIFEQIRQEPRYQEHHLYAANCVRLIREKQALGKMTD